LQRGDHSANEVNDNAKALPQHVAIVMDGNGRWAKRRGLPRHAGHKAGTDSVRTIIEESVRLGVQALTLFAFSSENWRRPRSEVNLLMELFITALQREVRRLHANNIRLRVIGDISPFPAKLQDRIKKAEELTAGNEALMLQIAANYGGRWDIVQAARYAAQQVKRGQLEPEDIDEARLAGGLTMAGLPDPDLFIRTGGDQRISNFLLWQSAYTELYFTDVLWPDFGAEAYQLALQDFARRQRRFGRTSDQVRKQAGNDG
jgi:undecaprenyl diphosphate synthase